MTTPRMTAADVAELGRAKKLLENPSLVTKLTSVVGRPIERLLDILPKGASKAIQRTTTLSLDRALKAAVATMSKGKKNRAAPGRHKFAVGITGALGGAFGLPALAIELPVSTAILLRSIADIARSKGEDVRSIETALACLQVFALGGTKRSDDAAESGYFAVRVALARAITEAAMHLAETGVVEKGAPVLVRLIAKIASRFGVLVGEKAVAQVVPVVGAVGGATINVLFMDHFQHMADGHFTVRRLERAYGEELVRAEYERLPK
jgi:hypothetical protein